MAERIYKLQPDRTVYLRGFDFLGASAAVVDAAPDGFTVKGTFRDAADFAVVVLYDADNFFEHPRIKYLPDFNFDGLVLSFDLASSNLMPLNSRKYATIDWPYLDVETPEGVTVQVRLSEHAEVIAAPDQPASAEFQIDGDALDAWDRVTLWYQNMAFDYIVPGKIRTEFTFYAGSPGTLHSIWVADREYSYTEQDGDTSAAVAAQLIAAVNGGAAGDPEVQASQGSQPWMVQLERKLDTGAAVPVAATGNLGDTLYHVKAATVCRALRDQINGASYAGQAPFSLTAEAVGTTLRIKTIEGGYDANFLSMYTVSKNARLRAVPEVAGFNGGSSTAVLRVRLDFAALGLGQIRKMWLTLAPRLANAEDYQAAEWEAQFTNWTVTGPEEVKRLAVAGPGSVRVEALDTRCEYTGAWMLENGFYPGNAAKVAEAPGAGVTVRYYCAKPHDLWIWTSLGSGRGAAAVEVDGQAQGSFSAMLGGSDPVITRRKVAAGLQAGDHTVRLAASGTGPFHFAGLEAAVESDVPEPVPAQSWMTPALDYSTDHAYKLPPARILWNLKQLGCSGGLNEYIGIFWWNERKRAGGVAPEVWVEFGGAFAAGDQVFVDISGQRLGKTVLLAETPEVIARHFALIVNASMVGLWARTDGPRVILRARSAAPAYEFLVEASVVRAEGSSGVVSGGGWIRGGTMGTWEVDTAATQALNAGARAWHENLYRLCAAEGRPVTTALSMELVNPPQELAARYPDGAAVITDMGFGGLRSTHCAFGNGMLGFHKRAFLEVAGLMAGAGLTPDLQFGEFTWWYFTNYSAANPAGGMAYYDDETRAAAAAALGRELHIFRGPDDEAGVNGGADALFLRNRLRDYAAGLAAEIRAAYPGARIEILFPYDVNYPAPAGAHGLGGRLNRYVNLPAEWAAKVSSGFDRFKVEALDFGVWSRNLELAKQCLELPIMLGWPPDAVRAMIAVFRGGYPWQREVQYARELDMPGVSLWAFDHVSLFGWELWDWGIGRASPQG